MGRDIPDILYYHYDHETSANDAFAMLGSRNSYSLDQDRNEMRFSFDVVPCDDFKFEDYGKYQGEIEIEKQDNGRISIVVNFGKNPKNAGRKKKIYSFTAAKELLGDYDASPVDVLAKIEELGVTEAARRLEVSRPTVYRIIDELKAKVEKTNGDVK